MLIRIIFLGSVFVGLLGCASVPSTLSIDSAEKSNDTEFLVNFGSCVIRPDDGEESAIAAIADVVVPKLIGRGLGAIGTALRNSGSENITAKMAHYNFNLQDKNQQCIQIAEGSFGVDSSTTTGSELNIEGLGSGVVKTNLKEAGLYLQGKPSLFLEMRVVVSEDKSAVSLLPTHFEYHSYFNGKSGDAQRALHFSIAFHAPGVDPTAQEAVGVSIVLGDYKPGYMRTFVKPAGDLTKWQSVRESAWFANYTSAASSANNNAPLTLTVTAFETRSANKVLLALAEVFDESKETIQIELEKELLTSKKKEAQKAEQEASNALLTSYYTDLVAAEKAVGSYCEKARNDDVESTELLELSSTASLAQLKANLSAYLADQPVIYVQFDRLTDDKKPLIEVTGAPQERICS